MTPKTQAGLFVETLEGARNREREGRKARLRLQLKARVRRFVEEFRTGIDGTSRPLVWPRKAGPKRERP